MEGLPVELIEAIASCHVLTIEDVVNLTITSKHLHEVMSNSAVVWKTKFLQRWPHFKGLFSFELYDWRNEVQYIYNLRKRTREILSTMSHRFYKRNELSDSDLSEWTLLASQHPRAYNYLAYDLMNIINENLPINSLGVVPLITPGNKTMQYYALKILRHIRQERLSTDWVEYISLPEEMQILEKGAVFVAQWCQPHIEVNWEDVAVELDQIADKVKETLRHFNPKHPLFSVPEEERALWRAHNLPSNKWKVTHCKQVITALGITLYQDLGFKGNDSAYYVAENSFINEVLNMKRGLPITLAIVYESVARRLGLKCEPVSFPAHFLLRFTEGADGDTYYIDVFNNGDIIRRGSCPHSYSSPYNRGTSLYPTATAQQVVERMANNLEVSGRQHTLPNGRVTRLRSALELLQLVNPQDLSARVSLARLYMLHNMDTKPLIDLLLSQELGAPEQVQRIVHMLQDYEMYRKKNEEANDNKLHVVPRPSSVRFAVGMVMKHLALHYKCVIYDWDPCCLASDEWQAQMHVNRLTLKGEQPFYNVLVEDGSHRYVAQENLEPTADAGYLYLVEDIGRHFSHFYQTHYVPNAEKEKEFPTDTEVRHLFHYRMVGDDIKT